MSLPDLLALATRQKHFDALRASVKSTSCRGAFGKLSRGTDGKPVLATNSGPDALEGNLVEALFQWSFYVTNGFFPQTTSSRYQLRLFTDALRGIYFDFLDETDQVHALLTDLKPDILGALVQRGPRGLEYREAISLWSRFVNRGVIEASPVDADIVANCFGRLLCVKQSEEDTTANLNYLAPFQTLDAEGRGADNPRPGLVEAAHKQHQNVAVDAKKIKALRLPSDSKHVGKADWTQRCLRFVTNEDNSIEVRTDMKVGDYPFPHDLEPNGDLHEPWTWNDIEVDEGKLQVTVSFYNGMQKTYTCPAESYAGGLVEYVTDRLGPNEAVENIEEFYLDDPDDSSNPVPYIYRDPGNNQGNGFRVETYGSYYELAKDCIPKGFYGNASTMVGVLMF